METTLPDRIRKRLAAVGKSPRGASLEAGLSERFITNIFDGKSVSPRADGLAKIARVLKTTEVWLLREEGPEEISDNEPRRVPPGEEFDPDPVFEANTNGGVSTEAPYQGSVPGAMPDVDVSAGAGPGGLSLPAHLPGGGGVVYDAHAVRGEFVFPDYVLRDFTHAGSQRVHFVKVRGDSMEPTLGSGDRVLVDTTDTAIGQGGVFVLLDPDGEVLVKRLRKLKGAEVAVDSDNPKQGSDVYKADEIRIIGRAVGRICKL